MPDLKNKQQLADAAKTLAQSYGLVQRGTTTFIPVHWETLSPKPLPAPEETIWLPMTREDKRDLATQESMILFSTDSELRSFEFMLTQLSTKGRKTVDGILIKTRKGLKTLNNRGELIDPHGYFVPNFVQPMLNEDEDDKRQVYNTIVNWLNSEEEAESLLSHLATILAPGYSAVKYVLLLGEGRNGKGVLLGMLLRLFGPENISNVTRQMMAEHSSTCVELNNKLLNIIFDGEMGYIKDSSMEKTLIAGETGVVRMLYDSGTTPVQTNALFIEALNTEPKARDKSPALQKRLVRFQFPNVYQVDKKFEKEMWSEPMLGALLALLVERYVREEDIADRLGLTKGSVELQMEQVWLGSPILQFIEHLNRNDPSAVKKLEDGKMFVDDFLASFKPWSQDQGLPERGDGDILNMMKTSFEIGWKTRRRSGAKPSSERAIKSLKPETLLAITQLKGEPDNGTESAV